MVKRAKTWESPPYKLEEHLPLGAMPEREGYVLLWEPMLYKELFEYARLAKTEGYQLADYPFFNNIEKYGLFKHWFIDHWQWFVVHEKSAVEDALAGITKVDAKKGFGVHFDTNKVSLDQALAYVKMKYEEVDKPTDVRFPFSQSMTEIKAYSKEKLIHKISDDKADVDTIRNMIDSYLEIEIEPQGLLPQQSHFSRLRATYQAFMFYKKLLKETDKNDDLLKVYVAHALGLFAGGGKHKSQHHYRYSLPMKIEQQRQIGNGTYVKDEFSYKGHPVDRQWNTFIETRKTKVTEWLDDCIETFICLGEGVFPRTHDKCNELEIFSSKTPNPLLSSYIKAAEKNKKKMPNSSLRYFSDDNDPRKTRDVDTELVESLSFVYSRITQRSPFMKFRYFRDHKFGNGAINFKFNDDFSVSSKDQKIALLAKLITEMENISKDQDNSLPKGAKAFASDALAMLAVMRGYIEDDLWFNDSDDDPVDHFISFEVDHTVGVGLNILFNNI